MTADLVGDQLLEQLGQRVLTDLADAAGRELEAALLLLDQAGVLELRRQLLQLAEALGGVVAEQFPGPVEIDHECLRALTLPADQQISEIQVAMLQPGGVHPADELQHGGHLLPARRIVGGEA